MKLCIAGEPNKLDKTYDLPFSSKLIHSTCYLLLRGMVLAGRGENICDEIVKRIRVVLAENFKGKQNIVSNRDNTETNAEFEDGDKLKVDRGGKIRILWSTSIHLESRSKVDKCNITDSGSQRLNMNILVKHPSASKLSHVPSHAAKFKLDNKLLLSKCSSCGKCDKNDLFQKVPYNTVMNHFAKALEFHPSNTWPPKDSFIQAPGGVRLGMASQQGYLDETLIIPPMIYQLHPNL
ncbi:LOW QUALITY PROTEIN: hypothetical protein ACHAW6_000139 [Cyclotella cf. meneghiniana]